MNRGLRLATRRRWPPNMRLREWMAQGMWVFAHDAEILSLGPYRYPVEDKTRASDKPAVDIPATERA
jgi:hypothetical protein